MANSSMYFTTAPSAENAYYTAHAAILLKSYRLRFGRKLGEFSGSDAEVARAVYQWEYPVLSHSCESEPKFNYANLRAQALFEADWESLIGLPSAYSAEADARTERDQALAKALETGGIENYQGERVTLKGNRFKIQNANLWTLSDEKAQPCGQAAVIFAWSPLHCQGCSLQPP